MYNPFASIEDTARTNVATQISVFVFAKMNGDERKSSGFLSFHVNRKMFVGLQANWIFGGKARKFLLLARTTTRVGKQAKENRHTKSHDRFV